MNYRKIFNRITLIAWSTIAVIFFMCTITLNTAEAFSLFIPAVNYDAGDGPSSVAIGDLNGDTIPDLAVANWESANVSIFINTGGYGDELAIDFGALGLWDVDTAGTWRQISGGDVETMASWAEGLAMDFGSLGVWNFDGTGWSQISGNNAEGLVGWVNGLAGDFGALGLWNVDTAWTWTKISGSACQSMAGWTNGLAMDFGSSGVWNVSAAGTWTKISGANAKAMTDVDLY